MVSTAIEKAQRKVEGRNFDSRKQLLEYDDVANDQRQVIYRQRYDMMTSDDLSEAVMAMREEVVAGIIDQYVPPQSIFDMWDLPGLEEKIRNEFGLSLPIVQWVEDDKKLYEEPLRQKILDSFIEDYQAKEAIAGKEPFRSFEKQVLLQVLDTLWKEHLQTMDMLRQGIHLRGYAQKNPKQEYKREAFEMFTELLERMKYEVVTILSKVKIQSNEQVEQLDANENPKVENINYQHAQAEGMQHAEDESQPGDDESAQPYQRDHKKIGRNDPCFCGSGKKYKQCHGKLT